MTKAIKPDLKDNLLFKQGVGYIDGEWTKAASGKTFAVYDPASEQEIGQCPEMDVNDLRRACEVAENAFKSFRTTTGRERAIMLQKWYNLCQENAEDLAKIITWENGKALAEAKGEVNYGSSFFQWFAEEAPRTYGDVIPSGVKGNRIMTFKQPVGVVGLITPW